MESNGNEDFDAQDFNLDPELVEKFSNMLTEGSNFGSATLAASVSHQANNDNVCK